MKFNEEQARTALCEALEAAIGRKMEKASDFDRMAEYVFEKTHEKVSTTTLKRLWGYLKEGYYADLTVFNEEAIRKAEPDRQESFGIERVFINGREVLREGKMDEEALKTAGRSLPVM